jgi:hypothetical protein
MTPVEATPAGGPVALLTHIHIGALLYRTILGCATVLERWPCGLDLCAWLIHADEHRHSEPEARNLGSFGEGNEMPRFARHDDYSSIKGSAFPHGLRHRLESAAALRLCMNPHLEDFAPLMIPKTEFQCIPCLPL